ncbi:MAG: MFS transporter [Rhodospirillales bacterium]|nr:MFS transporter [Rhodospirillales bacterium]MBO6786978.1 MFS transporter [Rhodospirillales bacterium]
MSTDARSARLSLIFSSIGHTYSHLFQPLYYVAVLTLEDELGLSHGEAIQLAVLGGMLFGFGAPVAGWLGDRFGAVPIMSVYYIGTGAAMILTGFAGAPWQIMAALALTGLFASIYHPVGIAWLIRNARSRGMALGINGIFGALGPTIAALTAGTIITLMGWRAVFIIPGVLILVTGVAFMFLVARGVIIESKIDQAPTPPAQKGDAMRVFAVLAVSMLCTGVIYQATQAGLPKTFQMRLEDMFAGGVFGISTLVAAVFFVAGLMQLAGGWLADKTSPKLVYIGAFVVQIPLLVLLANAAGPLVILFAVMTISSNNGALPAENVILARYIPPHRRALAFGCKFIIAIGFSALGVQLEALLFDYSGEFQLLFTVLAGISLAGAIAALILPSDRKATVTPQPAE